MSNNTKLLYCSTLLSISILNTGVSDASSSKISTNSYVKLEDSILANLTPKQKGNIKKLNRLRVDIENYNKGWPKGIDYKKAIDCLRSYNMSIFRNQAFEVKPEDSHILDMIIQLLYFEENEETTFLFQLRDKYEEEIFFNNLFLVYIGLKDANFQLKTTGYSGKEEESALNIALKVGAFSIAKFFIENGANINGSIMDEETGDTFTILGYCAYKNFVELVDLLCRKEVDINALSLDKCTAIQIAAKEKHWNIVEKLLDFGAKLNNKDGQNDTLLYDLIRENAPLYIFRLIVGNSRFYSTNFSEKNSEGKYPLHIAAQYSENSFEQFKWLWENFEQFGKCLNIRDYRGKAPLLIASQASNKKIFDFLLNQENIYLGTKDYDNNTVLHYAVKYFPLSLIQRMFDLDSKNDINVNALNNEGDSVIIPLLSNNFLSKKEKKEILDYLVEKKRLDVNIFGKGSNSPLFISLLLGDSPEYVNWLVNAGAKLGKEDGYNGLLFHRVIDLILKDREFSKEDIDLIKETIAKGNYDLKSKDENNQTLEEKIQALEEG